MCSLRLQEQIDNQTIRLQVLTPITITIITFATSMRVLGERLVKNCPLLCRVADQNDSRKQGASEYLEWDSEWDPWVGCVRGISALRIIGLVLPTYAQVSNHGCVCGPCL